MSNLTSASNEASISSSIVHPQQSFPSPNQPPPAKKKRNLPGNPDPDADVVALSPRTLMATNRFMCEICNKGFQRDQNLQLHRRGHNLPWKLKQRTNKEVRKKVYVCPEPKCVHHEPSRALGDLTGIKKHFYRKHGEKKWKCEKCSKRYAVQSDWKAHSKICGTREYRCDCGTLFSRRDSFISHRAFCDALAEDSARAVIPAPNPLLSSQPGTSTSHFNLLQPQLQNSASLQAFPMKREQDQYQSFNLRPDLPPWLDQSFIHHENPNPNPSPTSSLPSFPPTASSHMSATALLQKAAQMGVKMSKTCPPEAVLGPHQAHMNAEIPIGTGSVLGLSSREEIGSGFSQSLASFGSKAVVSPGCTEQLGATLGTGAPSILHNMMSSLPSGSGFEGPSFEEALNGMLNPKMHGNFQETIPKPAIETHLRRSTEGGAGGGGGGNDGVTRDFLGLRAFSHRGFPNMAGLHQMSSSSSYDQQTQNQTHWQV